MEDAQGILHPTQEPDQTRPLVTIFGPIPVTRIAYRHKGTANLYPADHVANLPTEKYSHGLREMAAREATQGSFDSAVDAIAQQTGQRLGKRQVEQLAQKAAVDVDTFYAQHPRPPAAAQQALVVSVDGKGIVMRRDGLRPSTAKVGKAGHKLQTRLSAGEKRGRKRMAEVGSVYDVIPVVRTPTDILQKHPADSSTPKTPGPKAQNKWLTASVVDDAGTVIETVMEEAERRDPIPPMIGPGWRWSMATMIRSGICKPRRASARSISRCSSTSSMSWNISGEPPGVFSPRATPKPKSGSWPKAWRF